MSITRDNCIARRRLGAHVLEQGVVRKIISPKAIITGKAY